MNGSKVTVSVCTRVIFVDGKRVVAVYTLWFSSGICGLYKNDSLGHYKSDMCGWYNTDSGG